MKRLKAAIAIGLIGLCGCSSHYVMKLNNGLQITTASKPKLKGGYYYFKDANGHTNAIPQTRVREIEPASMAAKETPMFKPTPVR